MFSIFIHIFVFALALTIASSLQEVGDQTIQLSPVGFRLPANVSNDGPEFQLNASNVLQVQCDGEKYGFNPEVADCENARSYYKRSSQLFTYGERHSGHGIHVFPLPYRLMGGMLPELSRLFTTLFDQNDSAKTHDRRSAMLFRTSLNRQLIRNGRRKYQSSQQRRV